MANLRGAVVVVTGAAGGIGQGLARAVAERGARVAAVEISGERADAAAVAIGFGSRGYACDVSDLDSVRALADAVERDFGGVNLVFANAGVAVGGKLTDTDPDEFQWMIDVNVRGAFNTALAFVPALEKAAAKGMAARLILTGSENSVGLPETGIFTAYTVTKHAILAMADGLRRDLEGTDVAVTIFCPGLVNTGLWDSRAHRQDRYGGAAQVAPEFAERAKRAMEANGQDPDLTARLVLEGIDRDEFLIITDPVIRRFATRRHNEVDAALDALDSRMAKFTTDPEAAK
jgi:NAD(P)-dependent dehydrogenase (short-subunit alcohol dehydrogenase family)